MAAQDPTSPDTAFSDASQVGTPKRDWQERLGGALAGSDDRKNSPLRQALDAHHQRRMDEAEMHKKNAATAAGALAYGIDPATGQPLTDEQKATFKNQYDAAMGHYEKIVGVDKNTKSAMQRARAIVEHLISRGGGGQGGQQGRPGGLTPPPQPGGGAGPTPANENSITGEAGITPPPQAPGADDKEASYKQFSAQAPFLRQQMEQRQQDTRKLNVFKQEEEAKQALKIKDITNKPDKYKFETIADGQGGQKIVAVDQTDPRKPYIEVKSEAGDKAVPGASKKPFANEGKLEVVGGVPTGRVMHGGRYVAPGDPTYTKEDGEAVNAGLSAQGLSQKQKEKLANIRGAAYATAAAHFKFTNVVDKDSGETGEVSALDMAKHPGKYSGASEQEKIAARDAVHKSLNVNFDAVDKSLDALPNGLDSKTQAIVKMALKNEDSGTIEQLIINRIKTMDPNKPTREEQAQLEYLTNLKALQEDVMTLRAVGGITGSSDTMRNAIVALVPGSTTASTLEAKMQLKAARRTSEALFGGRPTGQIGPQRQGGITPPPSPEAKPAKPPKKGDPLGIF